jgi:hypothetical protein
MYIETFFGQGGFMKSYVLTLTAVAVLALAGCSSTKSSNAGIDGGSITAVNAQKLTTNFKRKGVKLEWECAFGTGMFGVTDSACSRGDVKAVEVTAYATSNGNSENNREIAFRVAEMKAKATLRHFIYEDVQSSNVQTILTKNVEKANDNIKNRIGSAPDTEVVMTDEEAAKDKKEPSDSNFAVRENSNTTVRTVTETIRTSAGGILRGVRVQDEQVVDRQTVQVTIRWDKDNERASDMLGRKFRPAQ